MRKSPLTNSLDLQILGQRHKDIRNGLSTPPKFTPKHLYQVLARPSWSLKMLQTKNRFFGKIGFYELPQERSLNIDSEFYINLGNFIAKKFKF